MKYILAIDQGTTSTRAIIYDQKAKVISSGQKEISQKFPKSSWVNHDANEIWLSTQSVIAEALINGQINPEQIVSIGITNQRETAVVWDKKTGVPVADAIVWQSRQTSDICEKLISDGYEQVIKEKTGLKIDPYFSGTKIRWILDSIENGQKRAESGEILAGTIDTWLIWKLTNGRVHATDHSNASRTLLFNIESLNWDDELLEIFNIPRCMLPEIKQSADNYGLTSKHHLFGQEIAICAVAGDQHAALFGQLCIEPGMVKNTYGTGCFTLMNTGTNPVRSKHGLLTTIGWTCDGKVNYALEGSVFVAGSAVQWLRDGLKIIDKASETEQRAKLSTNEELYVVPSFVGLAAPYWNSNVQGSMFGLTRKTTDNDIIRATLRGISYQTNDVIKAMNKDAKIPMSVIKVDGGAALNNVLMQFQADISNVEIIRPRDVESTALGIAMLAGLQSKVWSNTDELKQIVSIDKSFKPQINSQSRETLVAKWDKAVKATIEFSK